MKTLVQRLVGSAVALGLTACVGTTENPEIKLACTTQTPAQYSDFVEVPANVDYGKIKWDRAYFQAIDAFDDEGNIFLFHLRFESDCSRDKGIKAIRVLSSDEVSSLGIGTRQQLNDYLHGKAEKFNGYLGPNLML